MDNEKILKELMELSEQNNGFVNPHAVVEYAKNPTTSLHAEFDWDDSEAGIKWRLHQARNLITKVWVTVGPAENNETIQAFVSLVGDRTKQGGYRFTEDILKDEDLTARMLRDAENMMRLFIVRFKKLEYVAKVIEAMESILATPSEETKANKRKRRNKQTSSSMAC